MKTIRIFLQLPLLCLFTYVSTAQLPVPGTPGFLESVMSVAIDDTHVYAGGYVALAGENSPDVIMISAKDGSAIESFPYIDGMVTIALPDGEDGWYVAGIFTQAGGYQRNGLARILAGGLVDENWAPDLQGFVGTMFIHDGKLYLGGSFSKINGQERKNLARLNLVDASLDEGWAPTVDRDRFPEVRSVAVGGEYVYVGGFFSEVNGQPKNYLARLDLEDGSLDESWDPSPNASVNRMSISDGSLFVAGEFRHISGKERFRLAKFDMNDGNLDEDWETDVRMGNVNELLVHGDHVYAGGDFYYDYSNDVPYSNLRRFSLANGTADPAWKPLLPADVFGMAITNGHLFAGHSGSIGLKKGTGAMHAIPGKDQEMWTSRIYKFDLYDGFPVSGFNAPEFFGNIYSISANEDELLLGGWLILLDPLYIRGLARYDRHTGKVDPDWIPILDRAVRKIILGEEGIYIGTFGLRFDYDKAVHDPDSWWPSQVLVDWQESKDAQENGSLFKIDPVSGMIDPGWDPGIGGMVHCLIEYGDAFFVGGLLEDFNEEPLNSLLKVDRASGMVIQDWGPRVDGVVSALLIHGDYLYLSGQFAINGDKETVHLARLSLEDGMPDPEWLPVADQITYDMLLLGDYLYVAGSFTQLGGLPLKHLARLNLQSGMVDPDWKPEPDRPVFCLAASRTDIFAGGMFNSIGDEDRKRIARLDTHSGKAYEDWVVKPEFLVRGEEFSESVMIALLENLDGQLYVGGMFFYLNDIPALGLARFDLNDPVITGQPEDIRGCEGTDVMFEVVGTSEAVPLEYQWQVLAHGDEWEDMEEENGSVLMLTQVDAQMNGHAYRCVVSDRNGQVISEPAILQIYPRYHSEETAGFCEGGSFSWRGNEYSEPGTFYDHHQTIHGCDSTFVLQLEEYPSFESIEVEDVCEGSVFSWRGNDYSETGTFYDHYQTVHGCDSTFVLELTVRPVHEFTEQQTICEGDVFTWRGTDYTAAGTYTDQLVTVFGCDSIFVLELSVFEVDNSVTQDGLVLTAGAVDASYQWVDCNNDFQPVAGATGRIFTATANGSYAVLVTQNNCSKMSECMEVTTVGVRDIPASLAAVIYPNPNQNHFTLSLGAAVQDAVMRIVSLSGQLVMQHEGLNGQHFEFNVSGLPKGIYVVEFSAGRQATRLRLVKSE
jgi:hypothetical protein